MQELTIKLTTQQAVRVMMAISSQMNNSRNMRLALAAGGSKVNSALTLAGVLITMWRNVDVVNQAEKVLRGIDVPVFGTTIRRTDIVDESTFQREPLVVYSPRSAACVDYRRLVTEYLERRAHGGEAAV